MKQAMIFLAAMHCCCAYGQRELRMRKPQEELITKGIDITLNKISLVHSFYPGITGSGIYASIKEQRFDSSDIDLKGRYFNSGIEAPTQTTHATIIATMMGGAGNSSSLSLGAASGVHLCSSDFANLFPDPDEFYRRFHISIENHSYGTGIENFYGSDAAAYDSSVFNNPTIVHVFSSGNSGADAPADGIYSGITGVANMTGSFKMAKNIITVGSVDSFNVVATLSSRGPAYDGRIKPELVAFGDEGSSGAAALVSGVAALLQESYINIHGHLPSAALVRAILLNSADGVNGARVSYVSGYGSMNAYRAMNAIAGERFAEDSVQKKSVKRISVPVPENAALLKITVAWTDPAAQANASKALINDIDTKLTFPPTNESWLPWVLSSAANIDSLSLPARRQTDSLNNVEQISVDHPKAGNYLLEISGDKLVTNWQQFAVAYLIDTAESFLWTYPSQNDALESTTPHVLRWETNLAGTGTLEYSLNNGPWQVADNHVNLAGQFVKWAPPDSTAIAQLRMTVHSSQKTVSSSPFTISRQEDMQVVFNCSDSFMLQWNDAPGRTYRIFELAGNYLSPVSTTTNPYIVLQKKEHASLNYGVAGLVNELPGVRSNTINYTDQGVGCYFQDFYASLENGNTSRLQLDLGGTYGLKQIIFQKMYGTDFKNLYSLSPADAIHAIYTDSNLVKGVNTYRVALMLMNGGMVYGPTQSDFYFPADPVIIFPNPIMQQQQFRIIASDPGSFTVNVYDVMGKLFYNAVLADVDQKIDAHLSRGIYFIKIFSASGKSFTRKLAVY